MAIAPNVARQGAATPTLGVLHGVDRTAVIGRGEPYRGAVEARATIDYLGAGGHGCTRRKPTTHTQGLLAQLARLPLMLFHSDVNALRAVCQ